MAVYASVIVSGINIEVCASMGTTKVVVAISGGRLKIEV